MKTTCFLHLCLVLLFNSIQLIAQDTFSIVAVDELTGQVGSAGASCIDDSAISGGVSIIGRLYPGRGVINTQSYWNSVNQNNAGVLINNGNSPAEIISWLETNDAQSNPGIRQYGIADFDPSGLPRTAAFTGANCFDYKNHITGPNYSIQGNILLGQEVLDSIEARFLNTEGELAVKLMAALQGAKLPGADTRCLDQGISSLSAYIRVANPSDLAGSYYLDLTIPNTPFLTDPITMLQNQFNVWQTTVAAGTLTSPQTIVIHAQPNPFSDFTVLEVSGLDVQNFSTQLMVYNVLGELVNSFPVNDKKVFIHAEALSNLTGIYFYRLSHNQTMAGSGKLILFR
ncbi:MAG: DUF1028 domain-containing protein [Sphingobacteriales bacterium]|nr:MAG: DUF1028 domain-containing protein [Sphingobacteriales bacterium]